MSSETGCTRLFFLMIRRPPRSTLFPYTDALPIFVIGTGEAVVFWVLGPIALAGALGMVLSRNAVHSALWLVNTMLALRSEEHTSELQSRQYLVCRLLLENKQKRAGLQSTTGSQAC